jgi:hypothetical protein
MVKIASIPCSELPPKHAVVQAFQRLAEPQAQAQGTRPVLHDSTTYISTSRSQHPPHPVVMAVLQNVR